MRMYLELTLRSPPMWYGQSLHTRTNPTSAGIGTVLIVTLMLRLSHSTSKPGKYHGMLSLTETDRELKTRSKTNEDNGKSVWTNKTF